ncbi:hypothetical protein ABK040_007326 [Willaertia magna]
MTTKIANNANTGTTSNTTNNKLNNNKWSLLDKVIFFWFCLDFFIHLVIEGGYVYFAFHGTVRHAENPTNPILKFVLFVWKTYGYYGDTLWLDFDNTIVSMEILTCLFYPIFLIFMIYYMWTGKNEKRYFWQIILCVCEIYGVWMNYGPESFHGFETLTTDPINFFFFIIVFSSYYVIVPALLILQAYNYYTKLDNNIKQD